MGVIGKGSNPFATFIEDFVEDLAEVIHDDHEVGIQEENNATNARRTRKVKVRSPAVPMNFAHCGKSSGSKKLRRYENSIPKGETETNFAEQEEVSIYDFMSHRVSAFAQLLNDSENLTLWNDFINCTDCDDENCTDCDQEDCSQTKDSTENDDKRKENPSYKPEESFRRINGRFRSLLKGKQLPMGTLADLENEVISFFLEWPRSVYVSLLPSGYHRLLLHSLCQYLDLVSRSYDVLDGKRETRVKNPRKNFKLPSMLLTEFIEKRFKR